MKLRASDPIYIQQFEAIDAEKGIIKGVKVCSEGDAKGHGVYLNKKFIKNVVRFGREQTVGVKARFGHPNMCDTTLGTYIGRFKNFKKVGEENKDFEELGKPRKSGNRLHAVADLHFDDTSKNLPKLGNVKEYLINLAESSPDMFGSSIVFHMGEIEVHKWKDDDGNELRRDDATIESLLATDLVDSPAATEGLFSEFSTDEMSVQVTTFLDQYPEVYELAVDNPEIVEMFMGKYADYKAKKETINNNIIPDTQRSIPFETSEEDMGVKKNSNNGNQIIEIMNKKLTEGFEALKAWFAEKFKDEDSKVNIPEEAQNKLNELETQIKEVGTQEKQIDKIAAQVTSLGEQVTALTTAKETAEASLATANVSIDTLKTDLVKAKAASTQAPGLQGLEDPDAPLSAELAGLNADLASLTKRFHGVEG